MDKKCININLPIVGEYAKQANLPKEIIAAKIGAWQETNGDKIPSFEELFYIEDKQFNTVNNLLNLQGKQTAQDTFYTIEGYETELKRPSTLAKKEIQRKEEFKTSKQIADQNTMMGIGTLVHEMQAEIIRREFPEANSHRKPMEITNEMSSTFTALLSDPILNKIIADAKNSNRVLMAEVFVGNLKLQRGGTIDLLGVNEDGSYIIYDLKNRFISDKLDNLADKPGIRRYNKILEFSRQLGEYKKILEEGDERLGIPKNSVGSVYVLENNIKHNKTTGQIISLNGINVVAPLFLRTEDAKLNEFINRLIAQLELLTKQSPPKDEEKKKAWEKLIASKTELLQDLQLRQDVTKLIEHASIELAALELYLEDEAEADTKDIISQLLLFQNLSDYLEIESLPEKYKNQLDLIEVRAKRKYKEIMEKGKEVVIEAAKKTGLERFTDILFAPIKDVSFFRKMTMGVADVDNPLVQTGYRVLNLALEKGRAKLDELKDKLIPLIEEYKEYMGKLDFSVMIADDRKSLVDKYSHKFYTEYYKNKENQNLKWAKENLTYDSKKYNEALQRKIDYEDKFKEIEIKKIRAWIDLQENLDVENKDQYAENIYWKDRTRRFDEWEAVNKNNLYFYYTPKSKWIDPKWTEIKEGKYKGTAVEKFYDFYTNYMQVANDIVPEFVRPTFIANFSQSFLERTTDLGLLGAIQGGWSELLNGLEIKYDEEKYGKVDAYTGEILRELYIPGLSKFDQNKSLDLGNSLLTFMEGVYRYQELSQIENTIYFVQQEIRNASQKKIDATGKPLEGNDRIDSNKNPAKQVSELFDYFVDAAMYGKKQKDEGGFKYVIGGFGAAIGFGKKGDEKIISYAKIADSIIRYTGLRNLSFNLFAPVVNAVGGTANMYMTGAGGKYYSNSDLNKSLGLLTSGEFGDISPEGVKLKMIINWLKINREKVDREIFNQVSNAPLSKIHKKFNGMAFMRKSEHIMVEAGAGAMILSGKHNINMEDFDVVKGKLVVKKEFTDLNKMLFREKVYKVNGKNIGQMSPDDVMLAKKWIAGRMIMQHRSWLPSMFFNRFGEKRYDYVLEKDVEGRYRVAFKLLKEIKRKGFTQGIESLSPDEIMAAKEAFAEIILLAGSGLILFALRGVDDEEKKEAWYKYTNQIFTRVNNELIFFADPTGTTQFQVLISPAATTSTAEELGKLIRDTWREAAADLYDDPDEIRKKAKPLKRLKKAVPNLGQAQRFLDSLYDTEE